jgi:hypothetical protein
VKGWVRYRHPLLGRIFYFNSDSREASWAVPEDLRFHLPDKLVEKMVR